LSSRSITSRASSTLPEIAYAVGHERWINDAET
jgi:hypothetical protein